MQTNLWTAVTLCPFTFSMKVIWKTSHWHIIESFKHFIKQYSEVIMIAGVRFPTGNITNKRNNKLSYM